MNKRELAFCDHYVKTGNASESAKAAGFSASHAKANSHTLLKRPHIQDQINWLMDRVREQTVLDAAVIVNELGAIALTRVDEFICKDDAGFWAGKQPEDLTEQQRAAVKEIRIQNIWQGKGEDRTLVRQEFKYVMHDKLAAIYKLGDHFGITGPSVTDRRNPFEDMDQGALDALSDAMSAALGGKLIEGETVDG